MVKFYVLATLLIGFSSTAALAAGGDEAKIQGDWRLAEAIQPDGKPLSAEERKGCWIRFRNGVLTVHVDGKAPVNGRYSIKPDEKPRQLDLKLPSDGGLNDVVLTIYELNGDTLKICHAFASDHERPVEFAPSKQAALLTFERQRRGLTPRE